MLTALRVQLAGLTLRTNQQTCLKTRCINQISQRTFATSETKDEQEGFIEAIGSTTPRVIRTVKRNVRGSPRKLTYLAQQIRGLPVQEALLQMKFSPKRKAEFFSKTVQNAVNLADMKYQIEPENLKVAECFVNKGTYLKRLRIMGRGRAGVMHHPYTHITVVLHEFDPSQKRLNKFMTKKLAREAKSKPKETSSDDKKADAAV